MKKLNDFCGVILWVIFYLLITAFFVYTFIAIIEWGYGEPFLVVMKEVIETLSGFGYAEWVIYITIMLAVFGSIYGNKEKSND